LKVAVLLSRVRKDARGASCEAKEEVHKKEALLL